MKINTREISLFLKYCLFFNKNDILSAHRHCKIKNSVSHIGLLLLPLWEWTGSPTLYKCSAFAQSSQCEPFWVCSRWLLWIAGPAFGRWWCATRLKSGRPAYSPTTSYIISHTPIYLTAEYYQSSRINSIVIYGDVYLISGIAIGQKQGQPLKASRASSA